jgi:hypothetical protein
MISSKVRVDGTTPPCRCRRSYFRFILRAKAGGRPGPPGLHFPRRRRDRFLAPPPPGAFRLLAFAAGGMASAHVHLDDHRHPREEGA